MQHRRSLLVVFGIAFLYLSGVPFQVYAFTNTQTGTLVLGQSSFTTNANSATATGENTPTGIAFDSSGNLWVADSENSRVLEYTAPLTTGQAASLVLGQATLNTGACDLGGSTSATNLCFPTSVTFDSSGNLWVTDNGNNRVLEYVKGAGFTTGEAASLVLGQVDFASSQSNQCGCASPTANTLSFPWGVGFDSSGNLWVADANNNRVLEYVKGAGFTNDQAASLVIGQPGFVTSVFATTATGLGRPYQPAFDSSGNLWVTDDGNARVLEYVKGAGFTNDQAASVVLGQSIFTSGLSNGGGAVSASVLGEASYLVFDSSGNLWVSDGFGFASGDSRVLEYAKGAGFSTGEAASVVIGQQDFTHGEFNQCNCGVDTGTTLGAPAGVAFDSSGNLWVGDAGNNRVLEYAGSNQAPAPLPPVEPKTITVHFNFPNSPTIVGKLVSTWGVGAMYNLPGYNPAVDINPYAITFCERAASNEVVISGFFSISPGNNATELFVSYYYSVETSAQGWPSEPACTS